MYTLPSSKRQNHLKFAFAEHDGFGDDDDDNVHDDNGDDDGDDNGDDDGDDDDDDDDNVDSYDVIFTLGLP